MYTASIFLRQKIENEVQAMTMRIALVVLLCVAAACSSTPEEAGDVELVRGESNVGGHDACEFMTQADVEEVYGESMTKSDRNVGAAGPSADVSTCTYQNSNVTSVVTMMATWSKSDDVALASRDSYAESAERDVPPELRAALAVEKVDFQGLPALRQAGQLKVFKEGVMLSILADPAPGKDAKQTMETLMTKAMGRL
jgi:hypothetical protein